MYQRPVAYKARKAVTLRGVSYARGELIPADVVRTLKVGVLLSRGILLALPDPHARKGYDRADPMVTYVPPSAMPIATANKTAGTLNASVAGRVATFSTTFSGPMFFDFGDGVTSAEQDGDVVHTYPGPGTFNASAESATYRGTKAVVIAAAREGDDQTDSSSGKDSHG